MSWSYLESSAAVKLFVDENESDAVKAWIHGRDLVASRLLESEAIRVARRMADSERRIELANDMLDDVYLYATDIHILSRAAHIGDPWLRTLDAIHLSTALRLEPELDAFITYDERLADAARAIGLRVVSPT